MNKLIRHSIKVAALTIFVGALPFLFSARVYAQEEANGEGLMANGENGTKWRWMDDPHEKVGFKYGADATLQTNYIWRGMYSGGLSLQGGANVGYGGLYLDMWWSLGAADYSFRAFQPELDLILGFSRWGIDVSVLYIYNFNKGFFDFNNYAPGSGGNGLEVRGRYTVSSKLPLSILWATRVSARDGYLNEAGELVRAYSSYLELSYTHEFKNGISLYGAVGITPWRSMYTGYKGGATVNNIDLRCWKEWAVSRHCGIRLTGQLAMNPYFMVHRTEAEEAYDYRQLGSPQLNGNIGLTVFLIR